MWLLRHPLPSQTGLPACCKQIQQASSKAQHASSGIAPRCCTPLQPLALQDICWPHSLSQLPHSSCCLPCRPLFSHRSSLLLRHQLLSQSRCPGFASGGCKAVLPQALKDIGCLNGCHSCLIALVACFAACSIHCLHSDNDACKQPSKAKTECHLCLSRLMYLLCKTPSLHDGLCHCR